MVTTATHKASKKQPRVDPKLKANADAAPVKRERRTGAQLIADLEKRIEEVRAREAHREQLAKVKKNPAMRSTTVALRAIDKAMHGTSDQVHRKALGDARSSLSAFLALNGVKGGGYTVGHRFSDGPALLKHIKEHPGQRSEEIATAMGTTSNGMRATMAKLIEGGLVKTTGVRRATTYSPS